MKPLDLMHEKIVNFSGWLLTSTAFGFNLGKWVMSLGVNGALTIFISILSACFLIMKMYDQYLITKERKRKK